MFTKTLKNVVIVFWQDFMRNPLDFNCVPLRIVIRILYGFNQYSRIASWRGSYYQDSQIELGENIH